MNFLNKKRKGIKTKRVFLKNNRVFIKKEGVGENQISKEEWYPVNFQWVSAI